MARSPVLQFVLGSLAAMVVVVVGCFFALRSVTSDESLRDTRTRVELDGRLVESAGLTDGVLRGDPKALAKVDDLVQGQVLTDEVIRVKIWSRDGRILYSDLPALIGQRYRLGEEEQEMFETGGADAEISDLSKPENRFERQEGKLLEAYTPIRTPDGTQLMFETYQRFGSVSASAARLLRSLAPPLIIGMVVLLLAQVPLAWRLTRRIERGHEERERLLRSAIDASDQERRRIASDLHDGVVQDLAGVAFGLAPLAEAARRRGDAEDEEALRDTIGRLRHGVRELRTLLVEIHPPSLESTGLEAALNDLLSPLQAAGIATELRVDDGAAVGSARDALVYRVAREALRNVQAHSKADSVRVDVSHPKPGCTRLVVRDDGRGFAAGDRERRGEAGHVGLTLLESLVRQSDGRLEVHSEPGEGTTVELEVPSR